ncbi:uncharacterized protein LOC111412360 [Olea europaea var. sylvestris]|uniref:uncharacterized protein LOC111412360 n=1 Tax=Olea europaea var. sylvestris TaxID=158386 RepID=UPI000C1D4CB7|nr:uncharacterized protein LOC111412360 [Olea europaea var. sylvestris]
MIKGALVSIKGIKKNDIYITTGEVIRDMNSSISSLKIDHTHTWHNRLAHVGVKGLKLLNKKGAFGNDCVSDLPFCDHCVLGKHHKTSFSTSVNRAKGMLEYVHSDLWGPASNPTSGGNRYFPSIIDDYTRKVTVPTIFHHTIILPFRGLAVFKIDSSIAGERYVYFSRSSNAALLFKCTRTRWLGEPHGVVSFWGVLIVK